MTDTKVFRRRVYHIGGYDHARPEIVHGRFVRELRRFERVWAASATASEPSIAEDLATWQVQTSGANWQSETEFCLVRWDDVIATTGAAPMWRRLPGGLLSFFDFILAGAFWGYLRASWRYAMFFLYPFLILAVLTLLALAGGLALARATGSGLTGIGAGIGMFLLLFHAAQRWLYLGLLLDDWIFSRRYIRRGDAVLDDRLQRVAADIIRAAQDDAVDEILIIGHSLGAVLAIDLIDRAITAGLLPRDGGPRITFLSAGSSVLKIGLHRGASRLRAAVARLSAVHRLFWADYQARSDVMNFYRSDPLPLMGLAKTDSPLIRSVSIRRMLDPARYPRIRRNWYRMHCQFVRGNDRRAPYDYFMFTCGPLDAERQARSKDGAMHAFDTEGRVLDTASSTRAGANPVEAPQQ
ncbi:hypothetical protein [Bosea psychrotolerans]|uniref:Uncharacterized protein n=1 Tax=Bosea psychrotolerans TaxID=1871628 RepID=A0A2S4MB80_9HYPH|nr:hypothetical protein [Bosea psychrotolerans]POR51895.1 hypothetical protein CYD53_106178 [Bosea psychrotolerans]